ncbi:hypothetical protein DFH11DRAFT_1592580 [Phellopilus nigrolimitatus]|nr:hypothetical protein DFH11DRAFT_1592580 [Phellopilus nigrolimitatus]
MSSKYFVHVSNISPTTTEPKLHDFFTFCGTIESIDFKGADGESTVYFEKPSAVTTALMLNGGTLEGAQLTVKTDDQELPDEDRDGPHPDGVPFHQSDKPRAGIAAEYLAMGYTLSDSILQRAIHLDNQKGISKRFLSYFNTLDTTVGAKALGPDQTVSGKVQSTLSSATDRARSVDEQKGYSKSANDYYSKAIASPSGQKVKLFYTTAAKRLFDIHEEARRIAKSKAGEPVAATPTPDSASNADQKPAQPTSAPEKA